MFEGRGKKGGKRCIETGGVVWMGGDEVASGKFEDGR